MAGRKKPSDYAAKCTKCQSKTEHFSGLCKNCRSSQCRRCKRPYQAKVNGMEICHTCKKALGEKAWHDDLVYQEMWVQ